MAILKCKMCGGDIELSPDKTFGTCDSCGSTMTFPKVDDEQRANMFNRGNHFRRTGEFDKALAVYERIVQEDDTDAEAHWCCALCRFGIEYVEDPATYEYLPTCHRASFDSFLEDIDYLAAVEHSDGITRRQYQKDAAKIAEVQRGILATSQNEEPFDVFICYKESENDGNRSRDSLLAQEIYYQLTEQGRRVFFSRITLEDKVGTEYEPYIFAALNSAKVMIVVTTSAEHVNSVWVKNEWNRFLSLMRKDRSKLLLPCYRDMDPYDFPEALSVLQSYDMSKIGFIQDLIRGVNKVLNTGEQNSVTKETVIVQQALNAAIEPLLKRAFMFLDDGKWQEADEYCERVLDQDPENSQAYVGKLLAELKVHHKESLKDCDKPFDDNNNYQKAIRFSDEKTSSELKGYIQHINDRNEKIRLEEIYNSALSMMNSAGTEEEYKKAADRFKTIREFKDSEILAEKCLEKAEFKRKNYLYESAISLMTGEDIWKYESAINYFRLIPGWKDSDKLVIECETEIGKIKQNQMITKKKCAKVISIVLPIIVVCVAVFVVLIKVIIPNQKLNQAMKLLDSGKYEEAYSLFKSIGREDLIVSNKYWAGRTQFNKGQIIQFGTFEQDNNKQNGKESIEWIILDEKNDKYVLLVSRYALDCHIFGGYQKSGGLALRGQQVFDNRAAWGDSEIRKWLNETFLYSAFDTNEINIIMQSKNDSEFSVVYDNSNNQNYDKVFLLSVSEAKRYFSSDTERMCKPTAYGKNKGLFIDSRNDNCYWWLRTQGDQTTMDFIAGVTSLGTVDVDGRSGMSTDRAVRPALWIKIT